MARINLDLSDVKDDEIGNGGRGGWSSWAQGDYRMMVIESEVKDTKVGNGKFLNVKLVCLDGEREGDHKFDILILEHPSEIATRIGRARLKELAIAVGHPTPDRIEDSEELHGTAVNVYITRKLAKDEKYADSEGYENRVAGYKAIAARGNPTPTEARARANAKPSDIPF